ncbi:MAG: histidine kinase [Nocardioidaceae bacterium]
MSAAVAEPIALENGRLQAELRANLDELRGSRARLIEAGQKERQRLERDLHDGAQQRLVALSLDFGVMETRLGDDPDATALLAKARDEVAVFIGRAARRRPRPAPSGGQRSASRHARVPDRASECIRRGHVQCLNRAPYDRGGTATGLTRARAAGVAWFVA